MAASDERPTAPSQSPSAALIVIGNEVLAGKVQDENTPFLIAELRRLGVSLRRIVVIEDDVSAIADEVRQAASRYDWVFTAGGVGPTHDDRTMQGVATAFGRPVVRSEVLVDALEGIRNNRPLEKLERLTLAPEGCGYFWGTGSERWPTVHVENVYVFPGVPGFLRARFQGMRELLRARPVVSGSVYCSRGETDLVEWIERTVAEHPDVEIGSYPRFFEVDYKVRVSFDARDGEAVRRAMDHFRAQLPEGVLVRVEGPEPN